MLGHPARGRDPPALTEDVGVLDDVLRRVFAGRGLEVRRTLRPPAQALLTADGIDGPVVHQGQEERAECPSGGVERLGRPPQRHEGVLDDLLGDQVL